MQNAASEADYATNRLSTTVDELERRLSNVEDNIPNDTV